MAKKPAKRQISDEGRAAIAAPEADVTVNRDGSVVPVPGLVEHPVQTASVVPISQGLTRIPDVDKGEKVFKFKLGGTEGVHLRLPGDDPRVADDKHKKTVEPTPVGEELELSHRQVKHLREHGICLIAVKPEEDVPPEPIAA